MSIYLIYGLVLAPLALLSTFAFPRQRDIALISGALATPFGLLDILFVQDYWFPPHIFGPFFSIEGMLFSFGNGVLVWMVAVLPFRERVMHAVKAAVLARRYCVYSSIALLVMLAVWRRGLGITEANLMTATVIGLCVIEVLILSMRWELVPLAAIGAMGFGLIYAFQLAILSLITPEFTTLWTTQVQEGLTLFGYPVEELIWAIVYGAVWTMGIAYGCDVRIVGSNRYSATEEYKKR